MKIKPVEIRRIANSKYRVVLETLAPDTTQVFEFDVTGDEIRVVESDADFEEFISRRAGLVKDLYVAILALDRSQNLEI